MHSREVESAAQAIKERLSRNFGIALEHFDVAHSEICDAVALGLEDGNTEEEIYQHFAVVLLRQAGGLQ